MLTHKLPNGRWLDVLCTALADGGELVIDFRDVTAAKELEEAKDLFLATTSHELRTPITVVQGFASTLASRWDQLGDARAAGRGADDRRAGRLAGPAGGAAAARLAGRGRPASGQQRPVRPRRRAARRRRGLPAAVGQAHGGRGHPRRPAPASGDTMATDIIVGPAAGERVQVLTRRRHRDRAGPAWPGRGSRWRWKTRASASPPEDRERIFDRFYQSETGDRRRFGGVGIGLFIVRRLAEAQHGEVTAMPRPGGGTVMRLRLRRAEG